MERVSDGARQKNAYTFLSKDMGAHATSIDGQVTQRIAQKGAGAVFTPADFLDLGSRNAVDLALSRRARGGIIRKLARGLYDTPRIDTSLGPLAPSTDDVANALRDRDGARLQAAGARAAHLLAGSRIRCLYAPCSSRMAGRGPCGWDHPGSC